MKRVLWIGLPVLLVVAGVAVYLLRPGVPVNVAEAKTGTVEVYIEERARTRVPTIYRITMPQDGRILPITLREGDAVFAGKRVAQMEVADLKTDLAEAQSRVEQIEQLIVSLQKTAESTRVQRDSRKEKAKWADEVFRKMRAAHEKGGVTDLQLRSAELQKLESAFDVLKENFTMQAIAAVQKAAQVMKQEAQEKVTQKSRDLNRAVITSPVSGIVVQRHVSNKQFAPAGTLLLEVARLDDLQIEADVLTQDAVQILDRADVDIIGAAVGPEPVKGKVAQIYPQGFQKTSSLGVEQQRVKVIIEFEDGALEKLKQRGRALKIDYRVRVRIHIDRRDNTLTIPRSAAFRNRDGNWQAYVVRGNFVRLVDLKVGLMNDQNMEILDGLSDGDRVVIAPESNLTDGTKVQVR